MIRLLSLLSCFLLFSCLNTKAQNEYITTKDVSKKIKEWYTEAYKEYSQNNFDASIKLLEKIIKKSPEFVNAYHVMADNYIQQKDWAKASEYFKKSLEIAPDYKPEVYYRLAQIAMQQEQYVEARKQIEKFLTYPKKSQAIYNRAEKILADAKFRPEALSKPVDFQPKNMGPNINSEKREYFPSVTADENTLIYTVQFGQGMNGQEDLYRSRKRNGEWAEARPLPNINTDENEAAQSVSADGKFLVFTVCNRKGDYGSCDLYYSRRVNGRWSKPQNIGAPINTANWESQPSVAPNGDAIYFTRGGARGQGDKNIWVSYLQEDGKWGKPEKVEELNTPYHDGAPCIHPDGQTLYFSSDGHAGMGSLDLFVSRKQEDGKWGKPQNLGYPINTAQAEEALAVTLSGDLAFIASDRNGGYGSLDIYNFELPEEFRPQVTTYVQAFVYDAKTQKALPFAVVEIEDLATGQLYAKVKSDEDGEFLVCLPMGKNYALNVDKSNYLFYSDNFALKEAHARKDPLQLKIPLQPVGEKSEEEKESKPVILKNVFFATNSADLRPASRTELDRLYNLLKEHSQMRIRLHGHTDNVGEDADNMDLSQRRALAVKQYLIDKGIAAQRLESKGFGETAPIASNETPEGRQQNRRTEFVVLN